MLVFRGEICCASLLCGSADSPDPAVRLHRLSDLGIMQALRCAGVASVRSPSTTRPDRAARRGRGAVPRGQRSVRRTALVLAHASQFQLRKALEARSQFGRAGCATASSRDLTPQRSFQTTCARSRSSARIRRPRSAHRTDSASPSFATSLLRLSFIPTRDRAPRTERPALRRSMGSQTGMLAAPPTAPRSELYITGPGAPFVVASLRE